MKANFTPISQFNPSFGEKFFCDTNVWLYLFYPQFDRTPQHIIDKYSKLFGSIKIKGNLILSHPQMFSEFINVWLKAEYDKFRKSAHMTLTFKEYRNSEHSKEALEKIKVVLNKVLECTTILSGTFTTEELKEIILNCDKADFNDLCFVELCKQQNCILVSHDIDYNSVTGLSIDIISANNKYVD
ncbi:MAG: PIN domain-containing protein [Bacteroidota bacterium]|nr:PIN domain-containing protein [Bacteroidota bacterium]